MAVQAAAQLKAAVPKTPIPDDAPRIIGRRAVAPGHL